MIPIQVIATGAAENGGDGLTWERIPEAADIQPGMTDVGELGYSLNISATLLQLFHANGSGEISFALGLPEGLDLPVDRSSVRVSADGRSLVYDGSSGEQALVQLDISEGWTVKLRPGDPIDRQDSLEADGEGQLARAAGQNKLALTFDAVLTREEQEEPPAISPEEPAPPTEEEDAGPDNDLDQDPETSGSGTEPEADGSDSGSGAEPEADGSGSAPSAEPEADESGSDPSTEPGAGKTGNDTETGSDTDMPDDQEEPETVDPAELAVTIPAGALEVGETFKKGVITLAAEADGSSAEAETPVELKEPAAPSEPLGTVVGYREAFKTSVSWVDNNNEDSKRMPPDALKAVAASGITFTVNGQTYPLNETNMAYLGMEKLPEATVTPDGVNAYTLTYPGNSLPAKLESEDGREYTVTWQFSPPPCEGYDSAEVTEDNLIHYPSLQDREDPYGWYYILKAPISFEVVLNTGASYNANGNFLDQNLRDAVLENFELVIDRPGYYETMEWPLDEIPEDTINFLPLKGGGEDDDSSDEYKTARIIIENGWKYNINGALMSYKIVQPVPDGTGEAPPIPAPETQMGSAPVGVGEDTLAVTYDNTDTTHDSDRDAVYPGGKLYLTLTGEAKYEATKVWQDQGVQNVERPTATLELWRYRNGEDFESAAPVRNSNNEIVSLILDPNKDTENQITVLFEAQSRPLLESLPKYDSNGFRYVYVVKEYLSGAHAGQYQQVFGEITETAEGSGQFEIKDTLPDWLPVIPGTNTTYRAENNRYLYNGGTLSNCLNVATKVEAAKTWKAASFQADFEHVIVELTLQSRPKTGVDDKGETRWGDWSNAVGQDGKEIRQVKYGFGEEELAAWNVDATVPKYGPLGRELDYRWVESAVYQAPDSVATEAEMKSWYEAGEGKTNLLDPETGVFTLDQNGRKVLYQSTTTRNEETGVQTVTNELKDTISYRVEKEWDEKVSRQEVAFALFRIPSGGKLEESTEAYMTFQMNADGVVTEFTMPGDAGGVKVTNPDGKSWTALVENLPEFDESGGAYQYVLMEEKGEAWVPDYDTKREENGDYTTVVTNKPGTGQHIMVRKEWVDNSDVIHRERVTVEVLEKGSDKLLNTVILDGSQEWNRLVWIGDAEPQNVYLKEVRVGSGAAERDVDYGDGADWSSDPAGVTGTYSSACHNYEVTYLEMQEILGEKVFTVRNRRVNTVDLTVTKLWKDNNGMLRKKLVPALDLLPDAAKITLSLRLKFAGEVPEGYEITNTAGTDNGVVRVGKGLHPQPIQDDGGNGVPYVQTIDYGAETGGKWSNESKYYFFNLPKYDETGAVVHYTVEEVWLDRNGEVIQDLAAYLKKNLSEYLKNDPDLAEMLKEYSFSVTGRSYTVGEAEDSGDSGAAASIAALYVRANTIVPDRQTIELTNRLSGTKTVYWHKLWDDYYPYSQGKRPDIYLDIFQMVHKEDETGSLTQVVIPYYRDYRWDNSTDEGMEGVLDQGNNKTHWHVVLDDLPKYDDETGREYYYYAVERTKVNIKQLDYADVIFYIAGSGGPGAREANGDNTSGAWPDNGADRLRRIGTARGTVEESYLAFGYNDPAEAYKVPEDLKGSVPSFKYYKYPDYMLLEGGYFSNTLSENVTIEGQKLWRDLPNSYPKVDLPAVKFKVYRSLDTGTNAVPAAEDTREFVAALTVTDWASAYQNGTYRFKIDHYTNQNGEPLGEDRTTVVADPEQAAKLPKYDENGRLYVYTLVEDCIIWPDGSVTQVSGGTESGGRAGIFNIVQGGGSFVASNAYDGVKGSLAVKKLLELETKTLENGTRQYVYPAVKFRLTRYYTSYENSKTGTLVLDQTFSQEKIWTSKEVKDAHLAQDPKTSEVAGTITFADLEKYAPNGSEYRYTVEEDTGYLSGYKAWAAKGDLGKEQVTTEAVSVSGLKVTAKSELADGAVPGPAATFLNKYKRDTTEKYPLVFQKVWRDYDDVFDLRPDTIKVKIYRYADSQPGQGNLIKEDFATVTLPADVNRQGQFKIEFAGGIPTYEIKLKSMEYKNLWVNSEGRNDTGWQWTLEHVERYAPNGMPWKYVIQEIKTDGIKPYEVDPKGDSWGWWNIDGKTGKVNNHLMPALVNSIYTGVAFAKEWKDKDGSQITQDYLGKDLTVTFRLQVKEQNGDWTNADQYFAANLDQAVAGKIKAEMQKAHTGQAAGTYDFENFTAVLAGRVNQAAQWKGRFLNLPEWIKKPGAAAAIQLEYRVVETSVRYDNSEQAVAMGNDGRYTVTPSGLVKESSFTIRDGVSTTANTLDTTSLKVQKIWSNDSFNQYKTRPATKLKDKTWQTEFVVQRSVNGGQSWEKVTTITLCGTDADSQQTLTIAGLPVADPSGSRYTYRIRELEPGTAEAVENSGEGYYKDAYTVSYEEKDGILIAANVLKPGTADVYTNYAAEKVWYPQEKPDGEVIRTAVFELQYLAADSKTWVTLAKVSMDGIPDSNLAKGDNPETVADMVYGEDGPWHAVWKNVPLRHPDSYLSEIDKDTTTYRVVETGHTPGDYITQEPADQPTADSGTKTYRFRFFNIQPTELTVKKRWVDVKQMDQKEVVAGLYRTTARGDVGKAYDSLAVVGRDGNPLTLVLAVENGWTGTFEDLPAYDTQGKPYYYYALEKLIGGETPSRSGFGTVYVHDTDAGETTISNSSAISITGTKTWLDNSNQGNTRPDALTLTLKRQAGGTGPWETVSAEPVWTKDGNVWTYTYSGLPEKDPNSLTYEYKVSEDVPGGYVQVRDENNSFTNTLTGAAGFTVTKRWVGPSQPDALTLMLYRGTGGINAGKGEPVAADPELSKNGSDWVYTYSGLAQYDQNGVPYTYWVEEAVPEGYDARTGTAGNNGVLENIQQGSLKVGKIVSGNRGETDREFHFRVTLSGSSAAGVQPGSVKGRLTLYEGEAVKQENVELAFTDGSAEFALKHDQSAVITGLPAGLDYTVEETEANQEGYTTVVRVITGAAAGTAASGTVAPGGQAEVVFQNDRHQPSSPDTTVTIEGSKTWVDNNDAAGRRPGRLELILYRSAGGREERVSATPAWSKNGSVWTYRYSGLPERIGGKLCVYRVEEVVPEGYTVRYHGNDLVNTLDDIVTYGGLTVSKTVMGGKAGLDARFHFTVTLGDTGINGVYGGMTFQNGVASFTLKDGESVTADGLPEGVSYTVTEAEADQNGYVTTATGVAGTILPGTTTANFVNRKDGPQEPLDPGTPVDPDIPDQPDKPGVPDKTTATDDPTTPGLWLMLSLISLSVVLALTGRKRYHGKREAK